MENSIYLIYIIRFFKDKILDDHIEKDTVGKNESSFFQKAIGLVQ